MKKVAGLKRTRDTPTGAPWKRFLLDELSTSTARCIQRSWMDRGDPQIAKSPAMLQATWVLRQAWHDSRITTK